MTIDSIFDTCDKEHRRTPGMDYDYFACLFEGTCPHKYESVNIRVKLYDRGMTDDDFVETIENKPRCCYIKSEYCNINNGHLEIINNGNAQRTS